MWRPSNVQWWILFAVTLLLVAAWPSQDEKCLATKLVNWVVDPTTARQLLIAIAAMAGLKCGGLILGGIESPAPKFGEGLADAMTCSIGRKG